MEISPADARMPMLRRKHRTTFRHNQVIEDVSQSDIMVTPTKSSKFSPVAPQGPSMGLLDLPQELQDIIFSLAYPRIDGFKYILKDDWDFQERERRRKDRDGYTARPFPKPKVCDFLVSKHFFIAAARAYVGNQTFNRMSGIPSNYTSVDYARPYVRCLGIAGEFMTEAVIYVWFTDLGEMPPSLKKLTVELVHYQFESLEPKLVWEDHLSDDDCKTIMVKEKYDHVVGLQEFHLVPGSCHYANTVAKTKVWHDNVRKFESYVRPYVTSPKEARRGEDEGMDLRRGQPLYSGSKVCFATSKLQKPERSTINFRSLRQILGSKSKSTLADSSSYMSGIKDLPTSMLHKPKVGRNSLQDSPFTFVELLGTPSLTRAGFQDNQEYQNSSGKGISDQHIPDDVEALKALLDTDGENVMGWIRASKARNKAARKQGGETRRYVLNFVLALSCAVSAGWAYLVFYQGFEEPTAEGTSSRMAPPKVR